VVDDAQAAQHLAALGAQVGQGDPDSPFWIVEASKEIVDEHGGIFEDAFLGFLRQYCDDRLRPLRPRGGEAGERSAVSDPRTVPAGTQ
jgi:hypothetical protein